MDDQFRPLDDRNNVQQLNNRRYENKTYSLACRLAIQRMRKSVLTHRLIGRKRLPKSWNLPPVPDICRDSERPEEIQAEWRVGYERFISYDNPLAILLKTVKLAVVIGTIASLFRIYDYFCIKELQEIWHGISERYNRCRQARHCEYRFRRGVPGSFTLFERNVPLPFQRTGFRVTCRGLVYRPQEKNDRKYTTIG